MKSFCERLKDASPNLLRVSASAGLLGASLYNVITLSQDENSDKINPWFFVFTAYSNIIYTVSNGYEAYEKLKPQKANNYVELVDVEKQDCASRSF